nr:reverse transcriptase [Tanacetum cinerariifolium]
MIRACPHHGFSELTQIDTFYNGLNEQDQDSLNATAGGNLLSKTTREALKIIENKSKVLYSRSKLNVSRVNTNSRDSASKTDDRIYKLAEQISNLVEIVNKKVITPATAKVVEKTYVICGVSPPNRASNQIPPPGFVLVQNNPNRLNDQKLHEEAMNQMRKFFQIFHDLHFDISFTGALLLMPKFASTIKSLLTNKDKLFELAKVQLNENYSAMLLKKLPEKLRDPGKFLIPCDFSGIDVCHALADLADRSITHPKGVAENVFVKVGKFHFPTDFVVLDFEANPRVSLILGRSFLRTGHALINVHGEEITLRVNEEFVTFNLNQTMRYSLTYDDNSVNRVDVIDIACEEFVEDPIVKSSSPTLTPFGESDFFLEEIKDFLNGESIPTKIENSFYDPEGDILYLEKLLNDDPFQLPSMDLKQAEETKAKSSIEEPPELELKELSSHLEYAFLEELDELPVIIAKDLKDVEKEALIKVLKEGIVLGHKILKFKIEVDREKVDVIAKLLHPTTIKGVRSFLGHAGFYRRFIQDFSKIARPMTHLLEKKTHFVFSKECVDSFDTLKKNLTEAPILVVPDWNLPFELMCDASDIAIGTVLGQRKTKHFQPIHYVSKTMTEAQIHYITTEKEMLAVVYAFEKFWPYLVLSKSIVYTDHSALKYLLNKQDAKLRLLRWILFLQKFDITIRDKKGSKNLAAVRLSRLENPHKDVLENKDINENFPLETLRSLSSSRPFLSLKGNKYILVAIDYLSKWVEAKVLPMNDAQVVVKFLKSLFSQFGTPRAIISDRRTHFCNDLFARVMIKYRVTHRLATAYHPQTSGQVEVSNRGLKRILERTVEENRCTPYKLVYGKSCHLPIELENKAYWTLKHVNFDLKSAGDQQKLQLNKLNELRDEAYENSLIYKERTKKLHDSKIKNHIFNVGDQVLLFNSRLKIFSGKLKTHWSGPFTITQVFLYGTIELSQPNGHNFKVNGHRVKHYFREMSRSSRLALVDVDGKILMLDLVPSTCVIFEHFIKIIIHSTSLNHPGCGTLPSWFRSCAGHSQTEASQSRQSTDRHKFNSWKNLTSHLPRACLMLALVGFPSSLRCRKASVKQITVPNEVTDPVLGFPNPASQCHTCGAKDYRI